MKYFDVPIVLEDCSLAYAGRCSAVPALRNEKPLYSVYSVVSGEGILKVTGKEHLLKRGSAFVVFPFEKYEIIADEHLGIELDAVGFSVSSEKIERVLGSVRVYSLDETTRFLSSSSIASSVKAVCDEINNSSQSRLDEILSLLCSQLLVYVARDYDIDKFRDERANDAVYRLCVLVMNYIDSRIYDIKHLSDVADAVGYNYCYLSAAFHRVTGNTLRRYIIEKRMNEAKKLLSTGKITVSEIASLMNYSSVYAFSKAFKEFYGLSPTKLNN